MAGNPDPDDSAVGLNLILIGAGNPDVGRLNDRRGRRYHHRSRLRDHHRTRNDRIMDQSAHDSTDHPADESAAAVMVVMMRVMITDRGTVMRNTATRLA